MIYTCNDISRDVMFPVPAWPPWCPDCHVCWACCTCTWIINANQLDEGRAMAFPTLPMTSSPSSLTAPGRLR